MATEAGTTSDEFDLRPSPRVLPMLGEIDIDQWRCLAELIDNSIDGFLHATRSENPIADPEVNVDLPSADRPDAVVKVRDNGPGMTAALLQSAVSAGWSGNNSTDNLGLFGMGFNIATAKLGSTTEVWTTQRGDLEWHGLEIDFEKLRTQRHFRTAHLRRPKGDPEQHGTEVIIKSLKPDQRQWLAKGSNQTQLRKKLAQTYSAMLRPDGTPISFKLFVRNNRVLSRRHCVWNDDRTVNITDLGAIPAVIHFDFPLGPRPYCSNCLHWATPDWSLSEPCPNCESAGTLISRPRRIKGWVGIQRYLDKTEYGLDIIRNGRKIEINNKELFVWHGDDGDEPEYPIDDQRGRGRIVGEINIDHCRVSYSKDRFDRTDPFWNEMVQLLRGEGPLRPEKARNLGYTNNQSPLFKLFRAFRRTSPQAKVAGAWRRILVVKNNDRAVEMAAQFHDGVPEYQDDTKWLELVEETDRELLHGPATPPAPGPNPGPGGPSPNPVPEDLPGGLLDDVPSSGPVSPLPSTPTAGELQQPLSYPREEVPSLTRKYVHTPSGVAWNIRALGVDHRDASVADGTPWTIELTDTGSRTYEFLFNRNHLVFRSMTLTPIDALLLEIAYKTADFLKGGANPPTLARVLAELRQAYGEDVNLDPRQMQPDAAELLQTIARAIAENCPELERAALFNDLPVDDQQTIMRSLAARKIKPSDVISNGAFLQYAPSDYLGLFVERCPEYCFDGKIWDEPYDVLDYGMPDITNAVRTKTREKYRSLISDVVWLAGQDTAALMTASREELVRVLMSLRLLQPDVESA
jgi:hypothetical protein